MRSVKDYLIVFLGLTTLAAAGIAWQQYQELVKLRVAALNPAELSTWQKRLWETEKRRADLETQVAELQPRGEPQEESAEEPVTASPPRPNRRNGGNNFMAMMDRPEVQRLLAVQQRSALDQQYASLFKNLALTPDQLDKFKDLLVEKRTAMMDVFAAAREQGINPRSDPEAFAQLLASAQADIDGSIRSTLGETAFATFESFQKTLPQRSVVNQLEQRLSYSSTPLTAAQSDQMIAILAATSPSTTATSNRAGPTGAGFSSPFGGTATPSSRITGAAINQSLGVLAAPQVDALRQLQDEQQAQAALNASMRNRFQGTGSTPAGSAPASAPLPSAATAPRPAGG